MNCYGTNPRYTQPVQPVNTMNTMNTAPIAPQNFNYSQPTQSQPGVAMQNPQNPYNTTTTSSWSMPVPTNPNMPTSPASVPSIPNTNLPPTLTEPIYTPGYLRQHIGDLMRVEFLIGNTTTDRVGYLQEVGASFIVLRSLEGNSEMVCDIYSIKFVTIIRDTTDAQLLAAFPRT